MNWDRKLGNKADNKSYYGNKVNKKSLLEEIDDSPQKGPGTSKLYQEFEKDWLECQDLHSGQKQILDSFFEDGMQYIFIRAGRKFSKTATNIKIAWKFGMKYPNTVIYMGFPTITQAIEVVWEEKRLQRCDRKDDKMRDKYVTKTDDSKHIVWFTSGSYIKLIGTWSEARGRGTQPDLLIMDEVQDCSGEYLDAMDPNLAAKNGRCVMSGTPPIKENHYHSWEKRIASNPKGKVFKFSSYDNDKLPHLKAWLDGKREELIRSDKEDVWLREYMAMDCFSSVDRMLPDATLMEYDQVSLEAQMFDYGNRHPVLAVSIQPHYMCAVMAIVIPHKAIFVLEQLIFRQTWKKSFGEMYNMLSPKIRMLQDLCKNKMQNIVWDESKSFTDIVVGFYPCRKDMKWQERGILLLREMMMMNKIKISEKLEDFAPECQRLLRNESIKDIEHNYPFISTMSMLVNEFFQMELVYVKDTSKFDKYEALRDMGIPVPKKKNKLLSIFRIGN